MPTTSLATGSATPTAKGKRRIAKFAEFELDLASQQLWRSGRRSTLQPLQLALLVHLVENRERVVTREELLREVWGGAHVCGSAITQAVSAVRRALGEDPKQPVFLQTIRGRGYRFAGLGDALHPTDS